VQLALGGAAGVEDVVLGAGAGADVEVLLDVVRELAAPLGLLGVLRLASRAPAGTNLGRACKDPIS